MLSKMDINDIFRYAFGGGLLFFFAYICRPKIVGEMIESMGFILAPLFILGVGVAIYVFQRNVLGELFWYPIIHTLHYFVDNKINKRKELKDVTSPMTYLEKLGTNGYFTRREAYTAIRRLFDFYNHPELRNNLNVAHALRHVFWYITNIFIVFYAYIYIMNPSEPEIFSSIIKPSLIINSFNIAPIIICGILIIGAIISDILQLRYECYIIREYNRDEKVKNFLKDYGFINE